jgi:flagellin-like hook-associated protein FlgL
MGCRNGRWSPARSAQRHGPRWRHQATTASVNGSASLVYTLDSARESIGRQRATLGAAQHRLRAAAETSELRYESSARSLAWLTSADPARTASARPSAQAQQQISLFG